MINETKIEAMVIKIFENGNHGPFAIAISEQIEGSISFSLKGDVWKENSFPEKGMFVILDDLRKKRAGWRAYFARFLRLSDERS